MSSDRSLFLFLRRAHSSACSLSQLGEVTTKLADSVKK